MRPSEFWRSFIGSGRERRKRTRTESEMCTYLNFFDLLDISSSGTKLKLIMTKDPLSGSHLAGRAPCTCWNIRFRFSIVPLAFHIYVWIWLCGCIAIQVQLDIRKKNRVWMWTTSLSPLPFYFILFAFSYSCMATFWPLAVAISEVSMWSWGYFSVRNRNLEELMGDGKVKN